ncbi:hypothetical protein QVG61_05285 [Thiohalobacter sp. IOR34]|nr:hypothetical protein [Thiohalobacter sp. IOR34]WJW76503.1 hypothetical protein QVG61_05285 [Thiohalobacter sp. IOR34]
MLEEDAEGVIAATREGGNGWLLWAGLGLLLFLAVVRWWARRRGR